MPEALRKVSIARIKQILEERECGLIEAKNTEQRERCLEVIEKAKVLSIFARDDDINGTIRALAEVIEELVRSVFNA